MAGNRLAKETSPYLRQHAGNPVDWYAWGPDAFAAARLRDVPILLSVGYSACHWCHVMAHESFEDDGVAEAVNKSYVAVKVDREERPDVDSIYMEAVQAQTGGGGWPMTVFLLPDGRPFFGGTYFPRAQFLDLLGQIEVAWQRQRPELEEAADSLASAVRSGMRLPGAAGEGAPGGELLSSATHSLLSRHDHDWGGFGRAPKFPQPSMVELLLISAWKQGRDDVMSAALRTLDAMAAGGIYDHLGGGFARYSTDRQWLVPHFEKMLYDNALLIRAYLHAWQLTGEARYSQVVEESVAYLMRAPMRIPAAGFASAEDADSEGVEGKFYVWSLAEVLEVAGPVAASWFGVTDQGNWEGHNILRRPLGDSPDRPPEVELGRRLLLDRRDGRVRPGLDDKVLTEWNAMAVAALAEAGAALDRPEWVSVASEVATFLLTSLRRHSDGRWLRSWQADGGARHLAYAADHAWLIEAFVRIYEATGLSKWIDEARSAADAMIDLFGDGPDGTFYTTGRDGEELIARPVDLQDGALPSANSVAAWALLRLGALTGVGRYTERARAAIDALRPAMERVPLAFTGMIAASELAETGVTEVVVTGSRPDLLSVVQRSYNPFAVCAWGEPFDSPLWEGRLGLELSDLAFVCRNYACQAPARDPEDLASQLR